MNAAKTVLRLLPAVLWIMLLVLSPVAAQQKGVNEFATLQEKLVSDGFDAARIGSLFSRPEVSFDLKGVSGFFSHREARLNYDQFVTRKSIKKARKYIQQYQADLERAEKEFGVDKEVVTAIILVETRLGTVTGNRSVFNSLATFAALSDPGVRDWAWGELSGRTDISRERFDKWADRKSRWAYGELKAFLTYTDKEKMDPTAIYGSLAGALGIAQFMPSNILAHAKDGNRDGRVDLFDHADAIVSIASYLKHYGWHPGIDQKKAYKVVYRYNHSKYYVNTILKIVNELKS